MQELHKTKYLIRVIVMFEQKKSLVMFVKPFTHVVHKLVIPSGFELAIREPRYAD